MENRRIIDAKPGIEDPIQLVNSSQPEIEQRLKNAWILVARLERLSADSYYAHQASGLRGSMLRCLEAAESSEQREGNEFALAAGSVDRLDQMLDQAFEILVRAAQEITSRSALSNESK